MKSTRTATPRSNWFERKPRIRFATQKAVSFAPTILRFVAIFMTLSLCGWQVTKCLTKFFDEPIGTNVVIQTFDTYKLPAITVCPASLDNMYNFSVTFGKKCQNDEICRELPKIARDRHPFSKMGTSMMDLWNVWPDDPWVKIQYVCIHAVHDAECRSDEWHDLSSVDTIAGKCKTFRQDLEWYVSGKSFSWWHEIVNLSRIPGIAGPRFTADVHLAKRIKIMFVPRVIIADNTKTEIELSITKFERLNTSHNPCIDIEQEVECQNNCTISQFSRIKTNCRWPFVNTSLPLCDTMEEVETLHKQFLLRQLYDKRCVCRKVCNTTMYSLSTHITPWHVDDTSTFVLTLASNTHQIVTEFYIYPFNSLVSDLGGSIGLFLGISLLSTFKSCYDVLQKYSHKVENVSAPNRKF